MKKIVILFMIVSMLVFGLYGCNEKRPTEYEEMNEYVNEYFLAVVQDDYYQMKQMLPDELIQGEYGLENAKETDKPEDKDMKDKMGDRYSITGFDKFYKETGTILYLVEYYNYLSGNEKEPLIFAVTKENDKPTIIGGIFGNYVSLSKYSDKFSGRMFPRHLRKAMEEYPEHVFIVKEYPNE
ncbi:hypothetical protein [Caldifermentibacillus hisashii]|uniref:hypothetical protein n=1 Tax=Caldifermentibacillus hisashii TaxID=996558 RepID=UPI0022B959BA|nr:hypothetical protein [Caldifermentibacillus hisashii]